MRPNLEQARPGILSSLLSNGRFSRHLTPAIALNVPNFAEIGRPCVVAYHCRGDIKQAWLTITPPGGENILQQELEEREGLVSYTPSFFGVLSMEVLLISEVGIIREAAQIKVTEGESTTLSLEILSTNYTSYLVRWHSQGFATPPYLVTDNKEYLLPANSGSTKVNKPCRKILLLSTYANGVIKSYELDLRRRAQNLKKN